MFPLRIRGSPGSPPGGVGVESRSHRIVHSPSSFSQPEQILRLQAMTTASREVITIVTARFGLSCPSWFRPAHGAGEAAPVAGSSRCSPMKRSSPTRTGRVSTRSEGSRGRVASHWMAGLAPDTSRLMTPEPVRTMRLELLTSYSSWTMNTWSPFFMTAYPPALGMSWSSFHAMSVPLAHLGEGRPVSVRDPV